MSVGDLARPVHAEDPAAAEGAVVEPVAQEAPSKVQDGIVGANLTDDAQFETAESISAQQPQPVQTETTELTRMLSGTSWKKCSCQDGGEVLLLK